MIALPVLLRTADIAELRNHTNIQVVQTRGGGAHGAELGRDARSAFINESVELVRCKVVVKAMLGVAVERGLQHVVDLEVVVDQRLGEGNALDECERAAVFLGGLREHRHAGLAAVGEVARDIVGAAGVVGPVVGALVVVKVGGDGAVGIVVFEVSDGAVGDELDVEVVAFP